MQTPPATPPTVTLRALRKAHGLSLVDLAERIADEYGRPVHPDTLSNVELGWKRGSAPLMAAWGRALGLGHSDLTYEPAKRAPRRALAPTG